MAISKPFSAPKSLLALTLLLGAFSAGAQQPDSARTSPKQALEEVVITGQYGNNTSTKAVQKITVIDRRQIDAMGAQNLRDVLTNEAGVRLSQDNVLGSSISLQGISGQNIKYLVDGVPLIGRQNGDIDLSQVNLANIERIEIVRGPMSVSYGNNALGGTLNLITKKTLSTTAEGSLNAYYESIGTYNLTGRVAVQKGRHQVALNAGHNYFDGWNPSDEISLSQAAQPADSRRFQQWKPREQSFGDVQYGYRLKQGSLRYKGSYFGEEILNRGTPRAPYGEAASDDHYYTRRIDQAVFWNTTAIKGYTVQVQAAYNDYRRIKNTFARDLTTLGSELSQNPGDQDTAQFRLLHSRGTISSNSESRLNYELGYDVNAEKATGIRIEDGVQQIGDYAIFASAEYRAAKGLTLRPGLRWGYNTRYNAPVTPAINIRYAAGEYLTLRASYAKGFRAPDLKELYFYFVDVNHNIRGNAQLNAERSDNWTLNADYQNTIGKFRYTLEGSAFYNDIRNLISLAAITSTEYSYINVGRHRTHGAGLNTSVQRGKIRISAGLLYTGFYNQLSETEFSVATYSYSPEVRGSANYRFGESGFSANLFYKYTGRLPGYAIVDNAVAQTYLGSYHMADLSVLKQFAGGRYRISVGAKNLFDVQNITANVQGSVHSTAAGSTFLSTGRNYFLKLDLNLRSKS
jgi:outer membrane receptor for ferrienterochelin and colicins